MTNRLPSLRPLTYLITEGKLTEQNFDSEIGNVLDVIDAARNSPVSLVQIREKSLSARKVAELTNKAVELIKGTDVRILVNDRIDIAIAAGAKGVHLTQKSLSADTVRHIAGESFLIGQSVHTVEAAAAASASGADFVVFGPVFDTPGKPNATGIEALGRACESAPGFPVLALGGIDETNITKVLEVGATGFAAIRFLNDTGNLAKLDVAFGK